MCYVNCADRHWLGLFFLLLSLGLLLDCLSEMFSKFLEVIMCIEGFIVNISLFNYWPLMLYNRHWNIISFSLSKMISPDNLTEVWRNRINNNQLILYVFKNKLSFVITIAMKSIVFFETLELKISIFQGFSMAHLLIGFVTEVNIVVDFGFKVLVDES